MPARQKDNHMYIVRHNNIFVYVDIMIIYIDVFNGFYDFFPGIGQFYCRGGIETAPYNDLPNISCLPLTQNVIKYAPFWL